jgi:hypothetical protein
MKIRAVDAELIQKNGLMDIETDRGGYRHDAAKSRFPQFCRRD